eukprot:3611562-Heterocapsa_arctica.AAC.1
MAGGPSTCGPPQALSSQGQAPPAATGTGDAHAAEPASGNRGGPDSREECSAAAWLPHAVST